MPLPQCSEGLLDKKIKMKTNLIIAVIALFGWFSIVPFIEANIFHVGLIGGLIGWVVGTVISQNS